MNGVSLRELALELLSTDTSDPTDRWLELLGGAWALVDEFEHGGRRYFVAFGGPPGAGPALSPEERTLLARRATGASVKALAIDSGLSEATISRRLRRAMEKLGVRSQAQLARMLGAGGAGEPSGL